MKKKPVKNQRHYLKSVTNKTNFSNNDPRNNNFIASKFFYREIATLKKRKKKERKEKKEKKLETRSTHNRRCAQSVVANFPRRWNSGLLAQHLSHPPNKKSSGGDKRVPRGDISREDRG